MSLVELISGKQNSVILSAANANSAKVAKIDQNQVGFEPGLAGLATLAIAETKHTESATYLWRCFVLEADTVFKSSSNNAADSWELHMVCRNTAEACCRDGDLPAAGVELSKSLEALKGNVLIQPNLI